MQITAARYKNCTCYRKTAFSQHAACLFFAPDSKWCHSLNWWVHVTKKVMGSQVDLFHLYSMTATYFSVELCANLITIVGKMPFLTSTSLHHLISNCSRGINNVLSWGYLEYQKKTCSSFLQCNSKVFVILTTSASFSCCTAYTHIYSCDVQ